VSAPRRTIAAVDRNVHICCRRTKIRAEAKTKKEGRVRQWRSQGNELCSRTSHGTRLDADRMRLVGRVFGLD
jgi:hypothetical protein